MKSSWVLNASPLIVLGKSKLLEKIGPLAETWLIPEGVINEISIKSPIQTILSQLTAEAEVITKSVNEINPIVGDWNLGLGESEVLTLAMTEGSGVVVDDLQARKCAKVLEIPLIGSLGLVLMARKQGLIEEVRPAFDLLAAAGLYIDSKLIENILESIKEE